MLSHQWSDKKPFTRRVRWYCKNLSERDKDIRLKFEDEEGVAHRLYGDDEAAADKDWQAFRDGTLNTTQMRLRGKK